MNTYREFFDLLLSFKMVDPIYKYVLDLIEEEIKNKNDKNDYFILFAIYFSLLSEGNVCMSLDKKILKDKWEKKINATKILFSENIDFDANKFTELNNLSNKAIENYLDKINVNNLKEIIGENKIFIIDNNYLYLMKYNISRRSIMERIDDIFSLDLKKNINFDYKKYVVEDFSLSKGQEAAINKGINKNLIITGGPGTGKTTSILFLLLNLLMEKKDYQIFLVAPSGKASSRMKESIINGLKNLNDDFKNKHKDIIDIVNNLNESTIHRLLSLDIETKGFLFNKKHQFPVNSLFVIDEASMIDICLFDSLLSAIPNGARVFILGDKNQLPSVECGAVFSDLLKKLKSNKVELDESIRFNNNTQIYELANAINNGLKLPVDLSSWRDPYEFKIYPESKNKPIFYYLNSDETKEKGNIFIILKRWGEYFYSSLQDSASDLDDKDIDKLNYLFDNTEICKILCAENEGIRGVKTINKYMIKHFIDKKKQTSVDNYYAGELIMITKNNHLLDLYNGDSGILVTFKDDKTLYLMVKKSSAIVEKEGKENDKIFKIGSYIFYPFSLITRKDIDFAYGITIHKSQGSDYKNILVILPRKKGHPLINRQIVYTAITRTKGNTYIFSNQETLEDAKNTLIVRDTNIF